MATLKTTVTLKGSADPKYAHCPWVPASKAMVAALGGAGRIPIRGTINGHAFRSMIVRYGGVVGFVVNKEMRTGGGGLNVGDRVKLEIENDDQPRTIDVPKDLAAALKKAKLADAFAAMSFTHRKEHVIAILDAKKPETRVRRIERAVAMVGEKRKSASSPD